MVTRISRAMASSTPWHTCSHIISWNSFVKTSLDSNFNPVMTNVCICTRLFGTIFFIKLHVSALSEKSWRTETDLHFKSKRNYPSIIYITDLRFFPVSKVKQFPKTLQPGYTLLKTNKVENFIVEAFRESIKFLTDLKLLCSIQKGSICNM